MRKRTSFEGYEFKIIPEEDGYFAARFPDFLAITTGGNTPEAALRNAREALTGTLETMRQRMIPFQCRCTDLAASSMSGRPARFIGSWCVRPRMPGSASTRWPHTCSMPRWPEETMWCIDEQGLGRLSFRNGKIPPYPHSSSRLSIVRSQLASALSAQSSTPTGTCWNAAKLTNQKAGKRDASRLSLITAF